MDPIKGNKKFSRGLAAQTSKVNSVNPQVAETRTQFKETSIWDVSAQLMKEQQINIQGTTS